MSGTSNVGESSVYEGNEQKARESDQIVERFEEGKEGSHKPNDPKDERSIANRLANESNVCGNPESSITSLLILV